ncbi:MAG: hypothetical protein N2049_00395, partial [Anaerolineales bacterium]|nr:hypothetical protein [Anaerolineales bacterium]
MNTSQRIRFLERHGFIHDPFETPVAEQELGRYRQVFYSYYTPFYSITHTNILQTLRQPQHACVYGAPGQGKSTLRLTLEAECRAVFDGTLTVTYLLGEEIPRPLTLQEHGERLTRALVTDLTLGILEQFNPLYPPPTSAQVEALKMLLPAAGHTLERWIAILTSDLPEVDPHWGIGHYWTILGLSLIHIS